MRTKIEILNLPGIGWRELDIIIKEVSKRDIETLLRIHNQGIETSYDEKTGHWFDGIHVYPSTLDELVYVSNELGHWAWKDSMAE